MTDFFSLSWIYAQFIAVDANFKLKSKNRQINDPELGSGLSYFVETTAYTNHIANSLYDKEVSCVLNDRGIFLILLLGHELWQRVPCSQPGKFTWREGLHCQWRC